MTILKNALDFHRINADNRTLSIFRTDHLRIAYAFLAEYFTATKRTITAWTI
ncbi:MAG: hypothetical protein Q4P66_02225 [Actinomycetaceae bacterium]|nr:hypothetical protein [Actinomycetaceae bacterium]